VLFATMATSPTGLGPIAPRADRGEVFFWTFGWIVVLAIVAATLFQATLAIFDGCLGRIPDAGLRPPSRPRSSLSEAELLELIPSSFGDEP
jgi:hypothetical protein